MCRSKLAVPVQELQLINFNVVPSDDCIKCRQICADAVGLLSLCFHSGPLWLWFNFDQSKLQPRVVACLQPHGDTLSQLFEFWQFAASAGRVLLCPAWQVSQHFMDDTNFVLEV